ncbi:uncharacterized protein [Drosophila takahashii]|uniref:uncharacterized protein isoform X2 n=2 Tax=Drosophila takahashii TaxID=29030 RepID=UPI00389931B2
MVRYFTSPCIFVRWWEFLIIKEIFEAPEAIWSSSDGTHFMFALFNDTNVGMTTYPWLSSGALFSKSNKFSGNFFPETKIVRYPTPGTANPEVELWAVDITNLSAIQKNKIKPPASLNGQDYYLTSAGWISDTNRQVSVVYMGRSQNYSVISICSKLQNWNCSEFFKVHSERAPEDEWLDISPHPVFSSDGGSFLLLASIQESEEIFEAPEAIWSSSDGTHFMFALFNDTNVGMTTYPWLSSGALFSKSNKFSGNFFPETKIVRYPTPGTANPEVELWAVDITNLSAIQKNKIKPPASLNGQDYYLTSAGWISDTNRQVSVVYMGRSQNYSVISICSKLQNWNCSEVHSERAPEDEWLDISPHPVFSSDGGSFLLLKKFLKLLRQFGHLLMEHTLCSPYLTTQMLE